MPGEPTDSHVPPNSTQVADLLKKSSRGDPLASRRLADVLYTDLRQLAEQSFRREHADHTLQPTALMHESVLRLLGQSKTDWENQAHFLAVASQMMRRVLTDHARQRKRLKRGGGRRQVQMNSDVPIAEADPETILAVHEALEKLELLDPRQAKIVELRFFAGLKNEEIAQSLGVSLRTVEAEWTMARAWLKRELSAAEP